MAQKPIRSPARRRQPMGRISRRNKARQTTGKDNSMASTCPLRLLTWNIRYDWMNSSPSNLARKVIASQFPYTDPQETPWKHRREGLCAALELHAATHGIIALQEVLHHQLLDIHSLLNQHQRDGKWKYIGVGRDDGKTMGEYAPIFYNSQVHELISWRSFWLSETPDKPGRGWDSSSVRICTLGRFGMKRDCDEDVKHDFTIMVK